MQSHECCGKCTKESNPDGRRDAERCPCHETDRVAHQEAHDVGNGSVYLNLSASIVGKGGVVW